MSLAQSRDEQAQADAEMEEAAMYPYRRALEEIVEYTQGFLANVASLAESEQNEHSAGFARGGKKALTLMEREINTTIDKYELREELDL